MSAGSCPRCGGDGVHPSKIDPTWSVVCGLCKGTANYPPTVCPLVLWWQRRARRRDTAFDRLGSL